MNLFKRSLSFFLFVNIINTIFKTTKAKILLKIHIYNYKNTDNIKYDGSNCETFHWLNDHCDPQFHICISVKNKCDILDKNIKATDNSKIIYNVYSENIPLDQFTRSLSISVKVDDADANGSHDHIATFYSAFNISKSNENYQSNMMVTPKNLKVGLQARVSILCAENYQGETCDQRIDEINCLSTCKNGRCHLEIKNDTFACQCNVGWMGKHCYEKIISSSNVTTTEVLNSKMFSKQFSLLLSSAKFSEYSNEKYQSLSLDLTTKVIIICLLLLLSVCVLSLALVIKSWHRKNIGNNFFNPVSRPLPPIVFHRNLAKNTSAETHFTKPEDLQCPHDSPFETCIIKSNPTNYDNNLIQFDNLLNNIENPYEIPLIQNLENSSVSDDDDYENPIKFNKY